MNDQLHNMGSWQRERRDEDLALFHDMRRRERRNFLYPLKDDIDASPRRDEGFSTFCVSASTPTRNGCDLLPLDSEKNDYDWLLTPPSTPLFPSLDQDVPIVNLSQRRVLTRSASVSKTARLSYPQEPSPRITHGGNPSPRRPSTASSTSSTTSNNRGRPLSPSLTSRSSPTLRSSSPCRPSTPTGRNAVAASRQASRSVTPTLRRNNTSPSSANRAGLTSGRSRGKSLSPTLGPWEPSLPGFSAEPPPNLRTSLSDRTFQRGVSQGTRNGVKGRGTFAETSEGRSQSQWHGVSPDGSGNWSLSYANDHNSSQMSRASVVSSLDDDVEMAESVSTRSSSDTGPKSANVTTTKLEDPSMRRSVLPAKRQMRPAGSTADTMPFLSLSARKSYERQAAQRRSAQTMFRPLLSSAPVTSFYTTRSGGMHLRSSSASSMESRATQSGSSQLSRNEGLHGDTATEAAVRMEEAGTNTLSEEASLHQGGSDLREKEGKLAALKGKMNISTDCHEIDDLAIFGTPEVKDETAGEIKEDLPSAQSLEHAYIEDNAQQEDIACDMDADTTEVNFPAEECSEQKHTHRERNFSLSCADQFGTAASTLTGQSKESERSFEESKVKEHHVEDHKLVASVKSHSYMGSPHIVQRAVSDLGSFRRQSPMKNSNTRSHEGSLITEKTVSCDSFTSDSHSFIRSLASALCNSEPTETPFERSGDSMEVTSIYCESTAVVNRIVSSERPSNILERDALEKGVPLSVIPKDTIGDTSECNLNSESSAMSQAGLLEDRSQVHGMVCDAAEASMPEMLSGELGESLTSDATDKLTQQDVLSILGSCAPRIAALEEDVVHKGCTEAATTIQSRRFSDVLHTMPRLAGEVSEEADDLPLKQLPGVALLKRSVTLEEATDTILFCSSIVHELVYKAATLAIENEEKRTSKPLVSKRDFVTLFGFSGTEHKANGGKESRPRSRNRQSLSNAAVRETSSFVQKQRMVHRQTPALTMQQSPMDRIENAVMGNHEEIQAPNVSRLQKKKIRQGKRAHCRCGCCMM
eukprot:c21976_g1_i1 orf=532-3642(+)